MLQVHNLLVQSQQTINIDRVILESCRLLDDIGIVTNKCEIKHVYASPFLIFYPLKKASRPSKGRRRFISALNRGATLLLSIQVTY
jgi:hypothetical protein